MRMELPDRAVWPLPPRPAGLAMAAGFALAQPFAAVAWLRDEVRKMCKRIIKRSLVIQWKQESQSGREPEPGVRPKRVPVSDKCLPFDAIA